MSLCRCQIHYVAEKMQVPDLEHKRSTTKDALSVQSQHLVQQLNIVTPVQKFMAYANLESGREKQLNLHQAIKYLDKPAVNGVEKHILDTISYDLTHNNQLGFDPKNPTDFHVGIPYKSPWPADRTKALENFESTLKVVFLDVLDYGIKAVEAVINAESDLKLAKDKKNLNNLAHEIGALIDQIPDTYTAVIRLLIGNDHKHERSGMDEAFKKVFWPDDTCIVKKWNAQLLEDIKNSKDDLENLATLVREMAHAIEKEPPLIEEQKRSIKSVLNMFKQGEVVTISLDATMYNHTKVYCVDKKLLYVGSDNPYPNYNEEHGVLIDDEDVIKAWYDGNWKPR